MHRTVASLNYVHMHHACMRCPVRSHQIRTHLRPLHLFGNQTAQTQDTIQEFMQKSESAQLFEQQGDI